MSGSRSSRRRHNTIVLIYVHEELRELHAGQEDLPPGACRGTQRRPGRCSAAPLGKGRGLEKLQPRAERRRSGDLDGVPHPCWEGHLRKNENKMSNSDTRTCTKICEDVMPPLQKFHRLNSRRLVYPYEGSRSSMQGPPTRDSGGSVEGGRTRTRSLESQPRSRPAEQPLQSHPAGAFATGGVKPPSVGADAAEDLAGSEPGPRVGVPDRWQPARAENTTTDGPADGTRIVPIRHAGACPTVNTSRLRQTPDEASARLPTAVIHWSNGAHPRLSLIHI